MNPRYDTSEFEYSHGRKPRGYGVWAFKIELPQGGPLTKMISGPYGKAKTEALRIAKNLRSPSVHLLS